MGCDCEIEARDDDQTRILIILLAINGVMFVLEFSLGILAQSTALIADAMDMLADAIVYAISLYAVGRAYRHKVIAASCGRQERIRRADSTDTDSVYTDWHIYGKSYIMPLMMQPESLFNTLSDPTRLRALMLMLSAGEVCVCELTFALNESQPKISRHLALMRDAGIVESRREGTWMHYRLSRGLPSWSTKILKYMHLQISGQGPYKDDVKQLGRMTDRPRDKACA